MSRWCNFYNCWCSDAEEIIEDRSYCDFDCIDCEDSEKVNQKGNINNNYMAEILKKYSRNR